MSEKRPKREKVKTLLQNQTPAQTQAISDQIPHLMDNLVHDAIECQISRYGHTFEVRLGLTREDLLSEVREQIWKGLVTHKPTGKANLRTYLQTLIDNRFKSLMRKASRRKYSSTDYYSDPYEAEDAIQESLVTEETGETLFERRHEFIKDLAYLGETDRLVLAGLAQGYNIAELVDITRSTKVEVIARIGRIDTLLKKRREKE